MLAMKNMQRGAFNTLRICFFCPEPQMGPSRVKQKELNLPASVLTG